MQFIVRRRLPHVEQDLLTLPKHLRSPPGFLWGSCCLVFNLLCRVFCTIICLVVFLFLAMALSVYFQSMTLTIPLVSFDPLLYLSSKYVALRPFLIILLYNPVFPVVTQSYTFLNHLFVYTIFCNYK